MSELTFASLVDRAAGHLRARPPIPAAPDGTLRLAAVAVVLFEQDDEARYVLIRRARRGRNAGQWALPGGKVEPGETPLAGALREAEEEVGLPAAEVRVLGVLDDFPTKTGFAITPLVIAAPEGWLPAAASPEVASVHTFSVDRLAHAPDVVRWSDRDRDGSPVPEPLLQLYVAPDTRIHAPTGAILLQFREVGLHGRDTRVADLTQPAFTHR
ncbi:NUDIX hydrolase [Nocardioides insulae]|uniref:NUDIX hydrolase n=1 Tax=Nocardioides insulae TaxID=394734 RepID=UPI0004225075|nr:CoA pyrophosphatase [Nocardioides insulae]